jgi:Holliday junction resolvasome RuvABC endonuclease subunit
MSETKRQGDVWTVGIDPGLKETGVCLLDGDGNPVTASTIKADSARRPDLERIFRLSRTVAREVALMASRMPFDAQLRVGIEYPIQRAGNVVNYAKQICTLYAIEHEMLAQDFEVELVEINPTSVKQAAVGAPDATKREIIAASPFVGEGHTVETMADAWAIAVAARGATYGMLLNVGKLNRTLYQIEAREDIL